MLKIFASKKEMLVKLKEKRENYRVDVKNYGPRKKEHVEGLACIGCLNWVISMIESWQVEEK